MPTPNSETQKAKNKDISLCIINFNGSNFLPDTLESAQNLSQNFDEIIFVDNGSTDNSVDIVATDYPSVRIVRLGRNLGAAGARNAGIEAAGTRFLLFLDNDVLLLENCTEALMTAIASCPDASLAAPCVRYRNEPEKIQFCGADNHFLGLMILHEENKQVADISLQTRQTDSVVTAAFLVDRAKLSADNRFDEVYFYQMEDHDFGVRQRLSGHRILAVPTAQVLHGEGAQGLSIRRTGEYSDARIFGLIRNRWLFILKFYEWKTITLFIPIFAVYELAQLMIVIKKGWFTQWRRSLRWIFSNWGLIMKSRAKLQAVRQVSDRAFLKGGPIPHREELTAGPIESTARSLLNYAVAGYWRIINGFI